MGWAAAIMSGVGAANSAYDNDKATAAAVAEAKDNQSLANRAAIDAEMRGNVEAAKSRTQGTKMIAAENVAYANSGVDPTSGTPAAVMADTRGTSELDAQTHLNNAAREAWGFKRYGLKYGQQAGLEAARGSARTSATILGGVGNFASAAGQEYVRGGWGGSGSGSTNI